MLRTFTKTSFAIMVLASTSGGLALSDELRIGGTGTAHALNQKLGEAFTAAHPGDNVEVVPGLGSSGGISAVIEGALHLAVAGRQLKPAEREKGAASSLFLQTVFIFTTSHSQRQKLSADSLVEIYNGTLKKWPDGKEIKPILRPKSDSFSEYLTHNVKGMQAAMDVLRQRIDVPIAATDQDNVDLAEKVQNSLTGLSLVQFLAERPRLREIEYEGVAPSLDNLRNGRYPLKLDLHLVQSAKPSAVAARFVAFLKTPEAIKIISENGGLLATTRAASIQ